MPTLGLSIPHLHAVRLHLEARTDKFNDKLEGFRYREPFMAVFKGVV
jgi:hypothetical protein